MEIRATDLTIFRDDWSLTGVSFALRRGDALVIRGGNGSGKTSLLRCLVGLLPYSSGDLTNIPLIPESFHYLGHSNALKPSLSVSQNLDFWRRFFSSSSTSSDALDRMNISRLSSALVSNLSLGQARCVSLCRLFLDDRPVWVLDEPTTGLDESAESLLCDLIEERRERGIVIIATHRPLRLESPKTLMLGEN